MYSSRRLFWGTTLPLMTLMLVCEAASTRAAVQPAAEVDAAAEPDRAAIVEHAVVDNLERIVTGQYIARGTYTERPYRRAAWLRRSESEFADALSMHDDSGVRYSLVVRGTFDFDRQAFAFQAERAPLSAQRNEFIDRFPEVWYISLPDRTILASRDPRSHRPYLAGIYPQQDPDRINRHFRPLFDVRTLHVVSVDGLEASIGDLDVVAALVSMPDEMTVQGAVTAGTKRSGNRVFSWWSDGEQGYQVVRMMVSELPDSRLPQRVVVPLAVSETSWSEHAGVWLPATTHIRSRRGTVEKELELTFEWSAVNERIDSSLFDWHKWDLPDGSTVREFRLGEENMFTLHEFGLPVEIPLKTSGEVSAFSIQRFLLMVNCTLLAGIVGFASVSLAGRLKRRTKQ